VPASVPYDSISHGRLIRKNLISNSATVVKRSLIGSSRFNESKPYVAVEDYHLWLRLHQTCAVSAKLRLPLLGYRLSPGSISSSKRVMSKKIWNLLGEYEMYGKPLGAARRAFYFGTFVLESVAARVGGRPT
jgi:teichuronic acid biosynthesis glycosyltransferase TuaG